MKKAQKIWAAKCSYTIGGELVAGAGFEPAIPRPRDYDPFNCLSLSRPTPPFCRFMRFSSFLASPKDIGWLCHDNDHGPFPAVHFDSPALCCPSRLAISSVMPM